MRDDPNQIADFLVQEHGLKLARDVASDEALAAQSRGHLYELSIWRDVKRILRVQAKADSE